MNVLGHIIPGDVQIGPVCTGLLCIPEDLTKDSVTAGCASVECTLT